MASLMHLAWNFLRQEEGITRCSLSAVKRAWWSVSSRDIGTMKYFSQLTLEHHVGNRCWYFCLAHCLLLQLSLLYTLSLDRLLQGSDNGDLAFVTTNGSGEKLSAKVTIWQQQQAVLYYKKKKEHTREQWLMAIYFTIFLNIFIYSFFYSLLCLLPTAFSIYIMLYLYGMLQAWPHGVGFFCTSCYLHLLRSSYMLCCCCCDVHDIWSKSSNNNNIIIIMAWK